MFDKRKIDDLIPSAYEALKDFNIANKYDKINKSFSGQISSFGAMVATGSLLSAIASFSAKGDGAVEKQNLMKAIYSLINAGDKDKKTIEDLDLFEYIKSHSSSREDIRQNKREVYNAAIALKLAIKLYETDENSGNSANEITPEQ